VGAVRAWRERHRDARPLLLAGSIPLWLLIFSTSAPVYDGERLFLHVFPAWAALAGVGAAALWDRWRRPGARVALGAAIAAQGYGVVALHPFGLSYYNALVGGLPGAERLGLELTYWGDAVDRTLLDALARTAAPGSQAALVPTLHHVQAPAMLTPALVDRQVSLADQDARTGAPRLVVYRRRAYWPEGLAAHLAVTQPLMQQRRQGVWLAGIWPGPAPAAGPVPAAGGIAPGPD
jgi:hypothetical protein